MSKWDRHEDRLITALLLAETAEARIAEEMSMPRKTRRIDLVLKLAEPSDLWGVLRPWVANRLVVVEHFSEPVSTVQMATAGLKLAWVAERWCHGKLPHGDRRPILVVFCDGVPVSMLERTNAFEPFGISSIWISRNPLFGDILLVDLRHLPRIDGTSVLRLLVEPRNDAEITDRLDHLRSDSTVNPALKQKFLEAIMDGTIPAKDRERDLTYDS